MVDHGGWGRHGSDADADRELISTEGLCWAC